MTKQEKTNEQLLECSSELEVERLVAEIERELKEDNRSYFIHPGKMLGVWLVMGVIFILFLWFLFFVFDNLK